MDKLIDGLRHFRENLLWQRKDLFEKSARGQNPLAMLICCSDSRVLPESLMQADPGDLFISRNAGNLVPSHEAPGGEAAAIEYAVVVLGVKDIVVCGHYRCGAVKALLDKGSLDNLPMMAEWLSHATETRNAIATELKDVHDEMQRWDRAVELNVLAQVKNLEKHPAVARAVAAGKLRVHAWVLRFETGDILAQDSETGEFVPLLDLPIIRQKSARKRKFFSRPDASPETVTKRAGWIEILRHDLPASLAVFMIALPMCIAIARAAGAPPAAGILTGIVAGVVVGWFGGSPLQVSGPAAGLITILLHVIHEEGFGHLGVVVVLAGLLQIAGARLHLGQWFRAISPAVFLGMLSGIGVVLIAQQFHVMVDHTPERTAFESLLKIPESVYLGFTNDSAVHPGHRPAAMLGMGTLLILLAWRPLVPQMFKAVPSVAVAVVLTTLAASVGNLPIQRVDFTGLQAGFHWIDMPDIPALLLHPEVWLGAFVIAIVASSETLLCSERIERTQSKPRTQYDQQLAVHGFGNALCGLIGGLPLTAVAVRSTVNVETGARTRWSTVLHGIWLLLFAILAPGLISLIPTATLAAILVLLGLRLIDVKAIRALWDESRAEVVICLITAVSIVLGNLFIGIIVGVALSALKLLAGISQLRIVQRPDLRNGRTTMVLKGSATFLRLPKLAAALEDVPDGVDLHIDITSLEYIDHACLSLLAEWERQHETTGGLLVLDWDTLRARFQTSGEMPGDRRRQATPAVLESSVASKT